MSNRISIVQDWNCIFFPCLRKRIFLNCDLENIEFHPIPPISSFYLYIGFNSPRGAIRRSYSWAYLHLMYATTHRESHKYKELSKAATSAKKKQGRFGDFGHMQKHLVHFAPPFTSTGPVNLFECESF